MSCLPKPPSALLKSGLPQILYKAVYCSQKGNRKNEKKTSKEFWKLKAKILEKITIIFSIAISTLTVNVLYIITTVM